jgi:ABC-2 type transport system ATP-binding protein
MIQTRELTKHYGSLAALNRLTIDIGAGEVFGFIGPNGAGKTTTMKILSCLKIGRASCRERVSTPV